MGRKRFTFFLRHDHERVHPFPRIHPMWHKSQVNVLEPDLEAFPDFADAQAYFVDLNPGDLLYLPPYVWHHIQTLEASLSLSSLSHDDTTRNIMTEIYNLDHKFDIIENHKGQMFALRLFIDLLVHELVGNHPNETSNYLTQLLDTRYARFGAYFEDVPDICMSHLADDEIPTAQHVYGDSFRDMKMIAAGFVDLAPEVRDILLADYIEEISAQIVGAKRVPSFFRYCFQGQRYQLTDPESPEHESLWQHKSFEEDNVQG
eukprot:m.169113 g.169113  ORF g.169113 m.169113 type:complete len:260 (-) comp10362_c4_seq1:1569-2348(-)